jgi:hypothetical protein
MEQDFVTKKANQLISYHIEQGAGRHKDVIDAMEADLAILDEDAEKLKYLQMIVAKVNNDYATHLLKCDDPENCHLNNSYDHIKYFISKELKYLGVKFNDDTFTAEEKESADSKLDKILADLFEVKTGQKFIYEEFARELEELRNLYYLGKKNWLQLLVGKSVEMAASGIVSETISKQLIEQFNDKVLPLLKA